MNYTLESYTQYLTQFIPTNYKGYLGEVELTKSIEKEFSFVSKRLENIKAAEKFRELCKIEGAEIADYRVRVISFDDFCIIASIRFMGMDVTKPFVEIEFYNTTVENFITHFSEIKIKVLDEFKIFSCSYINVIMSQQYMDSFSKLNPKLDKPIYTIKLEDIYAKPKRSFDFSLEKIDTISELDYQIYLDEYKLFNLENPHLFSVHAEPFETINEKAKSDYVFKIMVDDLWAGLCMYTKDSEFIFSGYLVWDKIVFKKYRGHNLSAFAQDCAFQDFIPSDKGYLFGYIDPENHGSIKAAEKTGREFLVGFYSV
jgi:hypothetical protein